MYYRIVWVLLTLVGANLALNTVWAFADVMNGAMAIPNLVALLGLSGVIVNETRDYFKHHHRRADSDAEPPGLTSRTSK